MSRTSVNPYPKAASVRLFVAVGHNERGDRRVFVEPKGRLLTAEQRQAFETTFLKSVYEPTDDAGRAFFACCIPHHFFRYYDERGRQIGEVSICFCCSCINTNPDLGIHDPAILHFDYPRLKALIDQMGLPTNIDCDA